jgi:hypothetical protein
MPANQGRQYGVPEKERWISLVGPTVTGTRGSKHPPSAQGGLAFGRCRFLVTHQGSDIMCGRFVLTKAPADVAALLDVGNMPDLRPRYNIAPT